jgi:AhpD family alkylhydroperoxidase
MGGWGGAQVSRDGGKQRAEVSRGKKNSNHRSPLKKKNSQACTASTSCREGKKKENKSEGVSVKKQCKMCTGVHTHLLVQYMSTHTHIHT